MKNVLIADDHSIIRLGVKNIILENFDVDRIDEAENEGEVKALVKKTKYDLIVLDIKMPNSDFVKTLEWICILSRETNVLVFSMHEEELYGLRCLTIGAKGFLQKTCTNDEMLAALKSAISGKPYISPALTEILVKNKESKKELNPFLNLSSRELEIALFLNKGIALPEICSILNIQYSTGNTYKRRILEKLHVHNILSMSRLMTSFNIDGY